ncbi:class I tRNA ligase family protein [Burkholderia sp. WSM2232]|uniref:class I tRNA ligase family protein n=1 Tax=Burkholderia sp. WSM2232 TaxID=944436 RepID=UPI0009FC7E7E|nr:class I tRNA ligase family protein [Burkholderia sp. WSM2232]
MAKTTIVTATPPTPNGDLHVGHICGPYLGADIYTRYLRMKAETAAYVSYSDHNQTYVVSTAAKLNAEPMALADDYANKIRETLEMAGIEADTFHNPDAAHVAFVQKFFRRLYESGKLTSKTKHVWTDPVEGQMVFESYLRGHCAVCFAETAGAICESCGHPNDATTLKLPRNAIVPENGLVRSEVKLIVLELERYRNEITRFFLDKAKHWRPHLLQLVDELLARPLPDYPITYVSDWGIPAQIPGHEGQVFNVWAEMMPGLMHAAEIATNKRPDGALHWAGTADTRIVQFLGYDNSFFFALVHVALAFADGGLRQPDFIVTNEFYEFENFKFSTSKRNLIWGRDLLAQVPKDRVRYYLALSNPEYQKVNFTRAAMDQLLEARLLAPWRKLNEQLIKEAGRAGVQPGDRLELTPEQRAELQSILDRFEQFYVVEKFSPQRVAEQLSALLIYASNCLEDHVSRVGRHQVALVYGLVAAVLPVILGPLMPETAARIRDRLEMPRADRWEVQPEIANLTWSLAKSMANLI